MTVIVCPNLAVDRILTSAGLIPGEMTRCRALRQQAGGKGANVVRALRILGGESAPPGRLLGFAAGQTGRLFAHLVVEEGLEVELVACDGEMRVSTVVLGEDGSVTRLYELGPEIRGRDEQGLLAAVVGRPAAPGEWAVVDGAAPPGASDGFYASVSDGLRAAGYRVLVDAAGTQLAHAVASRPELVKVNLAEARSAFDRGEHLEEKDGHEGRDHHALALEGLELSRRLVAAGAESAIVTLGAAGAVGLAGGVEYRVTTPAVVAVNTVGSGDCFAAGLVHCLERGRLMGEALALAAGAAAANAASRINGSFDLGLARELAGRASVSPPVSAR
jgi:1-phosphofructokinase family hexose kinase